MNDGIVLLKKTSGSTIDSIPDFNHVVDCFNDNKWNPEDLDISYRHNVREYVDAMKKYGLTYLDLLEKIHWEKNA
jgi:hypothetical protein